MPETPDLLSRAVEFHKGLPERIRRYLNGRGIPDSIIDAHFVGWSGWRITIPIRNRQGEVAFFKLAKDPEDASDTPKMYATPGAHAELYGWDRVLAEPDRIVICEGEFDRLVLEARGFGAVTSTVGAGTFLPEWAEHLRAIREVYLCFDNDEAGRHGAARVAELVPHARAVAWPAEVGEGGDVTDFFVRLGRNAEDFRHLLAAAQALPRTPSGTRQPCKQLPVSPAAGEIQELKSSVAIESIVSRYLPLRRSGQNYVARCPFHPDRTPSFVVFPQTRSFHCFGCREHGDVFSFLMKLEHLSFPEAVKVIRQL